MCSRYPVKNFISVHCRMKGFIPILNCYAFVLEVLLMPCTHQANATMIPPQLAHLTVWSEHACSSVVTSPAHLLHLIGFLKLCKMHKSLVMKVLPRLFQLAKPLGTGNIQFWGRIYWKDQILLKKFSGTILELPYLFTFMTLLTKPWHLENIITKRNRS